MFNWAQSKTRLKALQEWYLKYERLLIPGALLLGFIVDILTFRFINFDQALLLLLGHIVLSGSAIAFIDLYEADYFSRRRLTGYLRVFAPLVIQYSFGAILSASVIFYSHSGSLLASWPFILVLLFLMIANEVLRKHYTSPAVQLPVYYFALYSYAILALPYLLNQIGPTIFIASSWLALAVILVFIYWLWPRVPRLVTDRFYVAAGLASVLILMNVFYFTNLIPPFPLALRDIGVYHQVDRLNGQYRVLAEDQGWLGWLRRERISRRPGEMGTVYVFASVFAPGEMQLDLVHRWQYRSLDNGRWQDVHRVSYRIAGGRDEGFRGYSLSRRGQPGLWRVRIETPTGQVIGQISFWLEETEIKPDLEAVIK